MEITSDIQNAIRKYLSSTGKTNADLAAHLGLTTTSVSNWLNGRAYTISNKNWVKLKPLIASYLYTDELSSLDKDRLIASIVRRIVALDDENLKSLHSYLLSLADGPKD